MPRCGCGLPAPIRGAMHALLARCCWPEQAIHHGPINKIKDVVAEYAASGLDLLVLMPEVRSLRRLELLSEQVLPEYRH
jgi:hypothetical protein